MHHNVLDSILSFNDPKRTAKATNYPNHVHWDGQADADGEKWKEEPE